MRSKVALVACSAVLVTALTTPTAAVSRPVPISAPSLAESVATSSELGDGVTRDSIRIGLHAPLSGAAPFSTDSMEKGKDLFFRWLESRGRTIHGRDVSVVLKNDQDNPSTAVAVCKDMVEREHVFMLVGFQGTAQIQACARYAASVGVPYVSPGVTSLVLEQLRNYFATSMSWPAQSRLLADMFVDDLSARQKKNGMVIDSSPNYEGAHDRFVAAMTDRGAEVHYDRRVNNTASSMDAQIVVQEMKAAGIQNVYVLVTPGFFLQILYEAGNQGYSPMWTGIGSGITSDVIANIGCNDPAPLDGAKFLSPYPAVAESDRFDPSFRNASR
ncbi:MAG: ABC transporter substrate-binding protein, partial [Actinobacteria bacterium]|nr:ABC transporter substrate-binding protein [Actinomycetota bacterium]